MFKSMLEMFIAVYKAKYANSETKVANQFQYADNKFTNPCVQVEWVAFVNVLKAEYIGIQEAWVTAGGNPGIVATREELIGALKALDEACDAADTDFDGKTTKEYVVYYHSKGTEFRSDVDVLDRMIYGSRSDDMQIACEEFTAQFPEHTLYSIEEPDAK